MAIIVFSVAMLGSSAGPQFAKILRGWGRRIQFVSAWILIMVGAALLYASSKPGLFDQLILK